MKLSDLNIMDREQFVSALGWIFEDSAWVAARTWTAHPFPSCEALHQAMTRQVKSASPAEQLALLRAHPDLGARARISPASTNEQAGAGLDQLTREDFAEMQACNQTYRDRFGFPFLFAVKGSGKEDIMKALRTRVTADPETELAEALSQVCRIAWFRLEGALDSRETLP